MRNVAIALKYSTNEERSYHPLKSSSFQQMRNVAVALKSSTNEERSYIPQVFDE